ncbi:hypothetical protein GGX14DRAFT_581504 [Mycena pura]|uniref:Uncharacterized protein n=1 Tax=Mycena pura TaxID=153505 RepID=A0AAD6YUI5_9AGAR|nr:hypothetical protein GGX14DRAFT_581504 [Mycena pura]
MAVLGTIRTASSANSLILTLTSLQATWIRNSILRVLIASKEIDAQAIICAPNEVAARRMVTKYAWSPAFPHHILAQSEPQPESVLVTVVTGVLGSHIILAELLGHPGIGNVYALNRSSGALGIHARQRAVFERKGSMIPYSRLRNGLVKRLGHQT